MDPFIAYLLIQQIEKENHITMKLNSTKMDTIQKDTIQKDTIQKDTIQTDTIKNKNCTYCGQYPIWCQCVFR